MTIHQSNPGENQTQSPLGFLMKPFRPVWGVLCSTSARGKTVKSGFLSRPGLAVSAILGIVVLAVSTGTVLATPGTPDFTRTINGRATLEPLNLHTHDFKIKSKHETDMIMAKFEIDAGGNTGWHAHPGPVLVTVAEGQFQVTRYTKKDGCTVQVYGPGEGFIGPANVVHLGEPEGGEKVVGYVTFLNVPVGGSPLDSSPEAPDCG